MPFHIRRIATCPATFAPADPMEPQLSGELSGAFSPSPEMQCAAWECCFVLVQNFAERMSPDEWCDLAAVLPSAPEGFGWHDIEELLRFHHRAAIRVSPAVSGIVVADREALWRAYPHVFDAGPPS